MSGLIKAGAAEGLLRPVGGQFLVDSISPVEPADTGHALETRIGELEDELAALKDALTARIEAAHREGLEAGRKERDERSADRLSLIEQGISQALSSWSERLKSTSQLAISVAKGALSRMVGNPEWRSEFIVGAIEQRMVALDRNGIVSIRVSAADFSTDEIEALGLTAGANITADDKLASGECLVELAMGHEELGISAQWGRLASLLDDLAEASC